MPSTVAFGEGDQRCQPSDGSSLNFPVKSPYGSHPRSVKLLRGHLGEILHELAKQKQSRIVEGHLRPDHVHMCISIPPKFSVSSVVGFIKGKSAISIARNFLGRRRNFTGESFWRGGYFVSTVGLDEVVVREYIRNQEKEDRRLEQLNLDWSSKEPD